MAVFAMAVMIGPAIGPTLGGWIVDNYAWPWIFYINLPVGAVAVSMVMRFVHEPEDIRAANRAQAARERGSLDVAGIVLLAIALSSSQFLLEEGASKDWFHSPMIVACAMIATFALAAFTIQELTHPAPAVNLRLFADPVFLSGSLIGAVMFAILMANMFLLPVFLQELLGYPATHAGLAMMPRALVMMVATPLVGRLYNRVQPRLLVLTGIGFLMASAWMMSGFTAETGGGQVVAALAVQGVGFSFLFVPLTTVALSNVPRSRLADAAGLNSLLRQYGGAAGLAVFATMLGRFTVRAHAGLAGSLDPGRPEVAARLSALQGAFRARGLGESSAMEAALRMLDSGVHREAAVQAFEKAFLLGGVLFLFVLPLLFFLRVSKSPSPPPGAAMAAHAE